MSKEQQELLDEAYENYVNKTKFPGGDTVPKIEFMYPDSTILTQEEFINKCKTDKEFSEKWGLKIEERELSLEERFNIKYPGGRFSIFQENFPNTHRRNNPNDLLDAFDIPTKLITITYNDTKLESYE
jgi:hypothetical protein